MSADRIEVELPDGSIIDAPAGTTKAQIQAKLDGKGALPVSSGQGVAKEGFREAGRVADQAVRKGGTTFPGFLGDSALAVMRNLPIMPGILGFPGLMEKLADPKKESPVHATKFGDVQKALETGLHSLPDVSKPKTETGKGVANVLEAVVSAASGGGAANLGQRAAIGLGSGVGGEAAARATDDNPIARVLGSLLGGGGTAAVQAWRPNLTELVQDATGSLRGSDWQKAKIMNAMAKKEGMPVLASQLLGQRSTLDDVVAQASANPTVRPQLITHMGTAPKKVETLVNTKVIENLSPATGERNAALNDIQAAAENAIRTSKTKSNAAFVKAMPPDTLEYDPKRVESLYNQLQALAKSPKYGETSDAGKAIRRYAEDLVTSREPSLVSPALGQRSLNAMLRTQGKELPDNANSEKLFNDGHLLFTVHDMDGKPKLVKNISELRGYSNDQMIMIPAVQTGEKLSYTTNAHKINNLIKEMNAKVSASPDYLGLPVADVKKVMVQATPEFNAARNAKQVSMTNDVNPLQKSLIGDIARMGGGVRPDKVTARASGLDLMFNQGPKPMEIKQFADQVGPDVVSDMLREHISKSMIKVWPKDIVPLDRAVKAPSTLQGELFGAEWQVKNFDAALAATAKSQGLEPQPLIKGAKHFFTLLNSYKDVKLAAGVSPMQTAQTASTNIAGSLAEPFGTTRRFFGSQATTKTYEKLAEMVMSPRGLEQLEALGRAPKPERVKALVLSMMTAVNDQADQKEIDNGK